MLTRNTDYAPEGVTLCGSVEKALELLKQYDSEDVFIIGGGTVYRAFLPYCKKMLILPHIFPYLSCGYGISGFGSGAGMEADKSAGNGRGQWDPLRIPPV